MTPTGTASSSIATGPARSGLAMPREGSSWSPSLSTWRTFWRRLRPKGGVILLQTLVFEEIHAAPAIPSHRAPLVRGADRHALRAAGRGMAPDPRGRPHADRGPHRDR